MQKSSLPVLSATGVNNSINTPLSTIPQLGSTQESLWERATPVIAYSRSCFNQTAFPDPRLPNTAKDLNFYNCSKGLEALKVVVTRLKSLHHEQKDNSDLSLFFKDLYKAAKHEHQYLEMQGKKPSSEIIAALKALHQLSLQEEYSYEDLTILLDKKYSLAFFSRKLEKKLDPTPEKIELYFQRACEALRERSQEITNEDIASLVSQLPHLENIGENKRSEIFQEITSFLKLNEQSVKPFLQYCLNANNENFLASKQSLLKEIIQHCHYTVIHYLSDPSNTDLISASTQLTNQVTTLMPLFPKILKNNPQAFTNFWHKVGDDEIKGFIRSWYHELSNNTELAIKQSEIQRFVAMCMENKTLCRHFIHIYSEDTLTSKEKAPYFELLSKIYAPNLTYQYNDSDLPEYLAERKFLGNPLYLNFCRAMPERLDSNNISPLNLLAQLVNSASNDDQIDHEKHHVDIGLIVKSITMLISKFENELYDGVGKQLVDFVIESLCTKLKDKANFRNKVDFLQGILSAINCIKYQDLQGNNSDGKKIDGTKAVLNHILQKDLTALSTEIDNIELRLLSGLCQKRYSKEDFLAWISETNFSLTATDLSDISDGMTEVKSEVKELNSLLKDADFHYLHHNQIAALACVNKYTNTNTHNLFLRLGTGQGKTLVSALSAISLLKADQSLKRVYVFSSYAHLSKRDHEKMAFLFQGRGIESAYVATANEIANLSEKVKVVFADSTTFSVGIEHHFNSIMQKAEKITDGFIDILNPKNSAIILDEGDLTTLDDSGNYYLYNQKNLFNFENVVAVYTKEGFQNLFNDEKFFVKLNEKFPRAFDQWFSHEMSQENLEKTGNQSIDVANGKIVKYANSFAYNLMKENTYESYGLCFNFLQYAREFKKVLFLSGSINSTHMTAFNNLFKNQKPNQLIDIPNFYGNHRTDYFNKKIQEQHSLEVDTWKEEILKDVRQAIDQQQPAMIFVDSADPFSIDNWLELIKSEMPNAKINTITTEKDIEDGSNVRKACQQNVVTLATIICGRGVDFVMSRANEHGLHIVIAALPKGDNERLLLQMIGRTARLEKKGSYSILVKENKSDFDRNSELKKNRLLLESREKQALMTEVAQHFYTTLKESQNDIKRAGQKWVFLQQLIQNDGCITLNRTTLEQIKDFITHHVVAG